MCEERGAEREGERNHNEIENNNNKAWRCTCTYLFIIIIIIRDTLSWTKRSEADMQWTVRVVSLSHRTIPCGLLTHFRRHKTKYSIIIYLRIDCGFK